MLRFTRYVTIQKPGVKILADIMIPQGCVVHLHINTTTSMLRSSNLLDAAHDNKKHLRYMVIRVGVSQCVLIHFGACVLLCNSSTFI